MRLLEHTGDCQFRLSDDFEEDSVPSYTILSHTWGSDKDEVTFRDLQEDSDERKHRSVYRKKKSGHGKKSGYRKLEFCCQQSQQDGYAYFWVDTCCIDKSNNVELNTAITSMFRWYQNAKKCYVYLSDVPGGDDNAGQSTWESDFRACRWLTRGWTLQELLAPGVVEFYDKLGRKLGDKTSLETQICEVTGIPAVALRGRALSSFSSEEIISWQTNRTTKKPEDRAYSLMSMCGVSMVPIYGEGLEMAMFRLRREIKDFFQGVERQSFAVQDTHDEQAKVPPLVGREKELEEIHRALSSDGRRRTVVLQGLGGIGKTRIARAFASRHKDKYSAIFWFNVQDETLLKQTFAKAASRIVQNHPSVAGLRAINLDRNPDLDEIAHAVNKWLGEIDNTRWLAIYDNYDNPKMGNNKACDTIDFARFLPEADQGSIVLITRSSEVRIGHCISIRNLTNVDESVEILSNMSGRNLSAEDDSVLALTQKLEGLPLALITAGAYLRHITMSIAEYLRLYDTSWRQLHESGPTLDSYENRTLSTTWKVSLIQVQQQSELSAKLLGLWCYFSNQDLWFELLAAESSNIPWIQELTSSLLVFTEAVRLLCNFYFVEAADLSPTNTGSTGYSMHNCVHSWVIHVLNAQWDRTLARYAIVTIAQNDENNADLRLWATRRRLLQHADRGSQYVQRVLDEDADVEWSLHRLGNVLNDSYRLEQAEKMYLCALGTGGYHQMIKPGSLKISRLHTISNLGVLYRQKGNVEQAKEMLEYSLNGYEQRSGLGSVTPNYFKTLNNLANLYSDQGNLEQAEETYGKVLGGLSDTSRTEELFKLKMAAMDNLGLIYHGRDKLPQAERMFQQTFMGYEKAFGLEHPLTIRTMTHLGSLYQTQGKSELAEKMLNQGLQVSERLLGSEHRSTLDIINNLGTLYQSQENADRAQEMFERALKGYEIAFGAEHTITLGVINNLANVHVMQNRLDKAEKMYACALDGYERNVGVDHIWTLETANNLGILYREQGNLVQSERMHRRVLAGREAKLGTKHIETIRAVHHFGMLLVLQERFGEADEMYQRALAGYRSWPFTDEDTMAEVEGTCLTIKQEQEKLRQSVNVHTADHCNGSGHEHDSREMRKKDWFLRLLRRHNIQHTDAKYSAVI